ncbi:hypothetical protein ACJIZ3_015557 [Penstemon smallii]|uniref:Pentatricopeptide repeat-containing protein n=1 Tax=Penstemon smallii TaxID=265156 RepID=A0ABD3RNL7_9LAMI
MATFASFLSCSSPPPFNPLSSSLRRLPFLSFSIVNPVRNYGKLRTFGARVFASSPVWEFSAGDDNSRSKKSVLFNLVQEIEPLDVSLIQKDVPPTTIDAMKRTISGMLGLLPSDQFQVMIESLWEPLFKLLISSMMTGYTLRNAEYRLCLERNLDIYEGNIYKSETEDSKLEGKGTGLKDNGKIVNFRQESLLASEETRDVKYDIPDFGEMTPEARQYILKLHSRLSSAKKELHEVKRKSAALQMQQFVGEEKNDLLDYLRSLQPEKVAELSEPTSPELKDTIHSLVHGLLATLSPKMHSKGSDVGDNNPIGTVDFETKGDCIDLVENTSLQFQPLISLPRDYLARCMLMGHYLRGLEYRVELMELLSLAYVAGETGLFRELVKNNKQELKERVMKFECGGKMIPHRFRTPLNGVQIGSSVGRDPDNLSHLLQGRTPRPHLLQIHARIFRLNSHHNNLIATRLIGHGLLMVYAVAVKDLVSARKLFDEIPDRFSVYSWTNLISGYARLGLAEEALKLEVGKSRAAFDEISRNGKRSVLSWNVMIGSYVQNGCALEALSVFESMLENYDCPPNHVTMVSILSACAEVGDLDLGMWVHDYMRTRGNRKLLSSNVNLATALIDMYSKCGSLDEAWKVYDHMIKKDVVSLNAMIMGLSVNGKGDEALKLFHKMQELHMSPDSGTYLGVLYACSHSGFLDKGREIFNNMTKSNSITPKLEHYSCYVDLLARSGFIEEALCAVTSMPFEPNNFVWGALLNGCVLHNRLELAQTISTRLITVDPENSAGYVMLSNSFAADHHWPDVSKLREVMREKRVAKQPGRSWINICGVVHEFRAGSASFLEIGSIHQIMDSLLKEMRLSTT